jgi:hypothetical protein
MPTKEEEKKPYMYSCNKIAVLVVVLLLVLAYFALYRDGKRVRGGKWAARGGCNCLPPT